MTATPPPVTPAAPDCIAHLLLVDDDRLVLGTLAAGLRHMGYTVHTAQSAEQAQEMLEQGLEPALALVDVNMPGAGGLWLAQKLHDAQRVPFLMLSAHSDVAMVEQASGNGALGYLVKPMTLQQIQPAITAALERAQELQALKRTRDQLQGALDADRAINVATGITMVQYRMSCQNAFEMLRSAARAQRRKLIDMAGEVVNTCEKLLH